VRQELNACADWTFADNHRGMVNEISRNSGSGGEIQGKVPSGEVGPGSFS
jgi:hypothetical protein